MAVIQLVRKILLILLISVNFTNLAKAEMNNPFVQKPIIMATSERDPFAPFTWVSPEAKAIKENVRPDAGPLENLPAKSYQVIGVMVSSNKAIAVLRGRDAQQYYVTTGDTVGYEGGTIETISRNGLIVNANDQLITLPVKNKFEVNHETR